MTEKHLDHAEQLAQAGKNRVVIRYLHGLRGEWQLQQGRYAPAAESLHEAVRMAREVGQIDTESETQLALARFHLDQLAATEPLRALAVAAHEVKEAAL